MRILKLQSHFQGRVECTFLFNCPIKKKTKESIRTTDQKQSDESFHICVILETMLNVS